MTSLQGLHSRENLCRVFPKWDGDTMGQGHNGTGAQWDGDTMGRGHNGTGAQRGPPPVLTELLRLSSKMN